MLKLRATPEIIHFLHKIESILRYFLNIFPKFQRVVFLKRKTKKAKKGFYYKSFLRNLFSNFFKYLQGRNSFESRKKLIGIPEEFYFF